MSHPSSSTDPSPITDAARDLQWLVLASRRLVAAADAALSETGLARTHHRVLSLIASAPGQSVGEIARRLGTTKQAVTRATRELIAAGHVEHEKTMRDRRRRLLHLTDSGRDLEARLSAAPCAVLAEACAAAGPDAVDGLRRVLSHVVAAPETGGD